MLNFATFSVDFLKLVWAKTEKRPLPAPPPKIEHMMSEIWTSFESGKSGVRIPQNLPQPQTEQEVGSAECEYRNICHNSRQNRNKKFLRVPK